MRSLIVVLAAGLLASCNSADGPAPTGQVVATVDGKEITLSELNLELAGAPRQTDPKAQKALQAQALRMIVNRKLVAEAAREQKLDTTPEFAMARTRAEELALIGALERKLVATVPAPSKEEAERFVAEHPDSFAQRKIFLVDQLTVPTVPDAVLKEMEPLHSLGDIAKLLDARRVPYQRAAGAVDGATSDPVMIQRIASLPAGEPFVVRNGPGALINQVRETRVEPVAGAKAVTLAQAMLKQRRTQEIVGRQLADIAAAGAKSVKYNAAYAPPPPAAPKPAKAP